MAIALKGLFFGASSRHTFARGRLCLALLMWTLFFCCRGYDGSGSEETVASRFGLATGAI